MTPSAWFPLLPAAILAGAIVLLLLAAAFFRRSSLCRAIAPAAMLLAAAAAAAGWQYPGWRDAGGLLQIDPFTRFFFLVTLAGAAAVWALARDYYRERRDDQPEFDLLLLLATLAAALLPGCLHFLSFFVCLEILSVSLYALLAFDRVRPSGIEAGLKYLVLASVATAFLLFGMALLYADGGSMAWTEIGKRLAGGPGGPWSVAGLALTLVGIGFKLALVPFHVWAADVYQGAPAPATALLASVSKGAMFAFLLRLLAPMAGPDQVSLLAAVGLLAGSSILVGNLLALLQNSLKRLLAYSSIAHIGYMAVALVAGGEWGALAAAYYLLAYLAMVVGAFAVLVRLSVPGAEADDLDAYAGLAWRRPLQAAAAALFLFALAGIPLTAAFLGKFYILRAAVGAGLWWMAGLLALGSLIGVFVYLRVVLLLFEAPTRQPAPQVPGRAAGTVQAVAAALVVAAGVLPEWLLRPLREALAALLSAGR